jgi:hypothetical protein
MYLVAVKVSLVAEVLFMVCLTAHELVFMVRLQGFVCGVLGIWYASRDLFVVCLVAGEVFMVCLVAHELVMVFLVAEDLFIVWWRAICVSRLDRHVAYYSPHMLYICRM